jgi:UDP-glucose 4-epimerase
MNILVFGSCGFIGNTLISFYKKNPDVRVYGVDIAEKNEKDYFCISKDEDDFVSLINSSRPDIIINAAGAANVNLSFKDPEWDYASNVLMVFRLLNSIRKSGHNCKLVQLSSAAVYGNPLSLPVTENEPVKPVSPYGFHKLQSEILCKEFAEVYKVQVAIVRIFSAYGVGLRKQLFWDLYQKANASDEITLFGTGNESRDFINADDLVKALDIIGRSGEFNATIYNIANGEEIRIKDAVNCFLEQINWKGKLNFSGGNRSGDPLNWKADISRLSSLGYKKGIDFAKGIELYCKWIKESG